MSSKNRSVKPRGGTKGGGEGAFSSLVQYRALLEKLDSHAKRLLARYRGHIACREGCADCCSLSSVLAVEAYSMVLYSGSMPTGKKWSLLGGTSLKFHRSGEGGLCPLLVDDRCPVYDARPVICRTHGYPLLVDGRVNHCPKNFTTLYTIESNFILDLDVINAHLASINIAFMKENRDHRFQQERIEIRDLLKLLGTYVPDERPRRKSQT